MNIDYADKALSLMKEIRRKFHVTRGMDVDIKLEVKCHILMNNISELLEELDESMDEVNKPRFKLVRNK